MASSDSARFAIRRWQQNNRRKAEAIVNERYYGRVMDASLQAQRDAEIEAEYIILDQRGNRVHAIAHAMQQELPYSVIPEDESYIRGLRLFMADTGFQSLGSEVPVGSVKHCYGGRLDFLGIVRDQIALVDIKTGKKVSDYRLQVAGYSLALTEMYQYPEHLGLLLYLKPDAYELVEVDFVVEIPKFLSNLERYYSGVSANVDPWRD